MRITPISMAYTRHNSRPQNLRPQNQNVSFEGFFDKFKKEKKQEDKPLTEEETNEILGPFANAKKYTNEEINQMLLEQKAKIESGEIVPQPDEPKEDENYQSNIDTILDRRLY